MKISHITTLAKLTIYVKLILESLQIHTLGTIAFAYAQNTWNRQLIASTLWNVEKWQLRRHLRPAKLLIHSDWWCWCSGALSRSGRLEKNAYLNLFKSIISIRNNIISKLMSLFKYNITNTINYQSKFTLFQIIHTSEIMKPTTNYYTLHQAQPTIN